MNFSSHTLGQTLISLIHLPIRLPIYLIHATLSRNFIHRGDCCAANSSASRAEQSCNGIDVSHLVSWRLAGWRQPEPEKWRMESFAERLQLPRGFHVARQSNGIGCFVSNPPPHSPGAKESILFSLLLASFVGKDTQRQASRPRIRVALLRFGYTCIYMYA